jgi:serine protease Do
MGDGTMQLKLVLQHLAGAKSGQTEIIPISDQMDITLGREHGSTVQFDPDRDDVVSRKHALIKVTNGANKFLLSDVGSAHGTMLNGQKVQGEVELFPGDQIQLGRDVKFTFDLDPRPVELVRRTKVLSVHNGGAKPTGVLASIDKIPEALPPRLNQTATSEPSTTSTGGGSKAYVFALVAALAVALIGASAYFGLKKSSATPLPAASAATAIPDTEMTTEDIARKLSKSTVYIEMKWQAIDEETGKPLFHKYLSVKSGKVPMYVTAKELVLPWLTIDDENGLNEPIGEQGSGSGFVVSESGYILTNKHVAAAWQLPYKLATDNAYIVRAGTSMQEIYKNPAVGLVVDRINPNPRSWIPANGGVLFRSDAAIPIGTPPRTFAGRGTLSMQFANSRNRLNASLVRFSNEADVALIKIETLDSALDPVELADADNVSLGQHIVVVGYPGISQKVYEKRLSLGEAGSPHEEVSIIQMPTVTDGIIANLGLSGREDQISPGQTVGTMGDAYQLTVTATGSGNSGGPVVDMKGNAIGLFTYARSLGGERVTFAVPIKYGKRLMKTQ